MRLNQSVESTTVDENGRTVRSSVNKVVSWGDEPAYIKLYLQDLLFISDMPKKHSKILYALLKKASYAGTENGMVVSLSAGMKRMMSKELDYKSVQPIDNALHDLTKGKVLYRIETGVYQFNPYLFGKGAWQDISKLRLEINYDDIKGKTFKTVCEYKEEPDGQLTMPVSQAEKQAV